MKSAVYQPAATGKGHLGGGNVHVLITRLHWTPFLVNLEMRDGK